MSLSLNAVISANESTRIITGRVIYNPAYTYKFQLKPPTIYHFIDNFVFSFQDLLCAQLYQIQEILMTQLLVDVKIGHLVRSGV